MRHKSSFNTHCPHIKHSSKYVLIPKNLSSEKTSNPPYCIDRPQHNFIATAFKMLLTPLVNCYSAEISVYDMGISYQYTSGTNVLGLVFCGLVFGLTLGTMPDQQKQPLQDFFRSLAAATADIIDWVIKYARSTVENLFIARPSLFGDARNFIIIAETECFCSTRICK